MSDTQRLQELRAQIDKQIETAHMAAPKPLGLTEVTTIVRQVIQSLEGHMPVADILKFYEELEGLAGTIRLTRQEIASIQPEDISTDHIPRATDELDAVVGATEEATNKIMDVCDEMTSLASSCTPEISEKLVGCTTKIYEACNFQDITGQRITKVVSALKHIDAKVEALLKVLGEEIDRGGKPAPQIDPEKELLNGPQLPKDAASQDDIDRLLSGG